MKSDIIISTYPRSGSHFLQNSIHYSTGNFILKTHEPVYDKKVISIIRNPLDSIVSSVSMHGIDRSIVKLNKQMFVNIPYNGLSINDFIVKSKAKYESFYQYLYSLDNNQIIFKYEDLINNIELVIDFLCKEINIIKNIEIDKNIIHNHIYNHIEKNGITPGYSLTSKKNKDYNEIYSELKNDTDIKKLNDLYDSVLMKCINL
jgi:hypothetical protein